MKKLQPWRPGNVLDYWVPIYIDRINEIIDILNEQSLQVVERCYEGIPGVHCDCKKCPKPAAEVHENCAWLTNSVPEEKLEEAAFLNPAKPPLPEKKSKCNWAHFYERDNEICDCGSFQRDIKEGGQKLINKRFNSCCQKAVEEFARELKTHFKPWSYVQDEIDAALARRIDTEDTSK